MTECAALPANSARARGPRKARRASQVAGRALSAPKRAMSSGRLGRLSIGPIRSGRSASRSRAKPSNSRGHARRSAASRCSAVAAVLRSSSTAGPSSSGCATGTSGCSQRRPCSSSRSVRKNGEARPSGWTAEHTSWRKPSSVSGSVRAPPPGTGCASRTSTDRPRIASAMAAARPFGPEPTTTTSCFILALPSAGPTLAGRRVGAARSRRQPGGALGPRPRWSPWAYPLHD